MATQYTDDERMNFFDLWLWEYTRRNKDFRELACKLSDLEEEISREPYTPTKEDVKEFSSWIIEIDGQPVPPPVLFHEPIATYFFNARALHFIKIGRRSVVMAAMWNSADRWAIHTYGHSPQCVDEGYSGEELMQHIIASRSGVKYKFKDKRYSGVVDATKVNVPLVAVVPHATRMNAVLRKAFVGSVENIDVDNGTYSIACSKNMQTDIAAMNVCRSILDDSQENSPLDIEGVTSLIHKHGAPLAADYIAKHGAKIRPDSHISRCAGLWMYDYQQEHGGTDWGAAVCFQKKFNDKLPDITIHDRLILVAQTAPEELARTLKATRECIETPAVLPLRKAHPGN